MSGVRPTIGRLTLDLPAAIIGVQILVKGMEKLESYSHHPFIVTSLLILGSVVLVASLLPLWVEKRVRHAHALFHVAEGVAMSLSAIILLEKGKLRIPVLLIFVGLLYVAAGFLESRPPARREQLAGPMLRGIACALLAASVALAGFTALHDHDRWAYGTAGLLMVTAVALLLVAPRLLRPAPASAQDAGASAAAEAH